MSDESHEGSSPLSCGEGPGVRSEKRCSRCGITKPLDAFHKNKRKKDGRRYDCKTCACESRRAYNATHAEAISEYNRAYNATHTEYRREYNAAYHVAHAEAKREYSRAYKAAHAEAEREYRRAYNAAYRAAHPEYDAAHRAANAEAHRAQEAAYRAAHPDVHRAKTHRRRALKKGNGGVGFTAQELHHMRLTQGGECAYCCYRYDPNALTADHIIPLKQGGRHEAANICLACPKCNCSKGNRTPDQWLNRWYWDWRLREPEYIPPHWY